ncbi:hypothetical protein [Desulfosoma sp.]|uniref:hypothetical protein n=1 Tax=Desulfosoma sp. TaxID=2603217 RepID=UPI00404932E0
MVHSTAYRGGFPVDRPPVRMAQGVRSSAERHRQTWVAVNNLGLAWTKKIRWKVTGVDHLKEKG